MLNTLLPTEDNRQTECLGGPGKEYWVFGENFANDQPPRLIERSSMELGAWRVQVSPRQPATEDLFLNVMQLTDRFEGRVGAVDRVAAGPYVGCRLAGSDCDSVVLMRGDGALSSSTLTVNLPGSRECHVLVTDLATGTWHVAPQRGAKTKVTVSDSSHAAWFQGPAGTWQLTPESRD